MSTISVSNITTSNGTESLTLSTGNTAAGDVVVGAGGGVVIASNSTVNTITANATGTHFVGNVNVTAINVSNIITANITTSNGTQSLTLFTGNTAAGDIVVGSDGGVVIASNSTVNTITANATGTHFAGNVSVTALRANSILGVSGDVLKSNATGIYWGPLSTSLAVKQSTYLANGTHTKVANLYSLQVYCIGAGGGGGGATGAATATGAYGAAGGAGGTAAVKILSNSEVGATSNIVVGIGGTGGSNSTVAGGTGSNSSFAMGSGTLVIGRGGGGATGVTPGSSASGVNGDLNLSGQDGGRGLGTGVSLAASLSGIGGISALGFGGGGGTVRSDSAGEPGDLYGGGGGGAARANTAVSSAGGNGANGIVWVVEYYSI